jgi:hypothetical protein
MQEIRNILAHSLLTAQSSVSKPALQDISIKIRPAQELIKEYEKLWASIEPELAKLPGLNIQKFF